MERGRLTPTLPPMRFAGKSAHAQLVDRAAGRVPEVDRVAKRDRDEVLGAPVQEVEVKVAPELGRIQDTVWGLGDAPDPGLSADHAVLVGMQHAQHPPLSVKPVALVRGLQATAGTATRQSIR